MLDKMSEDALRAANREGRRRDKRSATLRKTGLGAVAIGAMALTGARCVQAINTPTDARELSLEVGEFAADRIQDECGIEILQEPQLTGVKKKDDDGAEGQSYIRVAHPDELQRSCLSDLTPRLNAEFNTFSTITRDCPSLISEPGWSSALEDGLRMNITVNCLARLSGEIR